jgi:hypothetical protein
LAGEYPGRWSAIDFKHARGSPKPSRFAGVEPGGLAHEGNPDGAGIRQRCKIGAWPKRKERPLRNYFCAQIAAPFSTRQVCDALQMALPHPVEPFAAQDAPLLTDTHACDELQIALPHAIEPSGAQEALPPAATQVCDELHMALPHAVEPFAAQDACPLTATQVCDELQMALPHPVEPLAAQTALPPAVTHTCELLQIALPQAMATIRVDLGAAAGFCVIGSTPIDVKSDTGADAWPSGVATGATGETTARSARAAATKRFGCAMLAVA